jgi:hypothetical protein
MQGSFQAEADLISVANNFDESIINTLFLVSGLYVRIGGVRSFPYSL